MILFLYDFVWIWLLLGSFGHNHGGQKCMQILPNETRGPLIKATSKIKCYGRNQ